MLKTPVYGRALALVQGCTNEIDKRQVVDFGRNRKTAFFGSRLHKQPGRLFMDDN